MRPDDKPVAPGPVFREDGSTSTRDEARALVKRAVVAIAESRAHSAQTRQTLRASHARVRDAERVIVQTLELLEQLRDAVAAVARLERAKAVPSEKVIVLLETLVIEADAEWPHPTDSRALLSEVVRWGVEAYYAA